jgi:hypothetical protein
MNHPILRPASMFSEERAADSPPGVTAIRPSAYPHAKRRVRPGWKATIVRSESFARLRAIQKSTTDPAIDLSYLTDACLQIALDIGAEVIVQRALDAVRPARTSP